MSLLHRALPEGLPHFVPDEYYTIDQYLAIEQGTARRYEYHEGHLVSVEAMAGGSPRHSRLGANAIILSGYAIDGAEKRDERLRACDAHTSDLRIAVDSGARYLYPDAVIVCGEVRFDTIIPSAINNPIVAFEVISPSSDTYDRGLKFDFYGTLDSLREYVLIDQDRRRVEVRHRGAAGEPWQYKVVTDSEGEFPIPSLDVQLPMARLYRNWEAPV